MKNKWTLDSRFKNTNLNANLKAQIRIRAAPHQIEAKKSNNSKLRTLILDLKKKKRPNKLKSGNSVRIELKFEEIPTQLSKSNYLNTKWNMRGTKCVNKQIGESTKLEIRCC